MNTIQVLLGDVDAKIVQLQNLRVSLADCETILFPNGNGGAGRTGDPSKTAPGKNTRIPATPPRKMRNQKSEGGGLKAPRRLALEKSSRTDTALQPLARATTPTSLSDKPTTLGAAMKQIIAGFKKPFTIEEVYAAVRADADFTELLKASPSGVANNLAYWSTKSGKLKLAGEVYTILEREFFTGESVE